MNLAKGFLSLLLVLLGATWGTGAYAIVPAMDLADLTDASEAVVYGRVLSLSPHWDAAHEMIYTTVTVQPLAYMKGDLGSDPVEFEMPGGQVDDITLAVSDVPQFEIGEEAVLFLRQEFFRVVGWCQGKWRVENGMVFGTDMTVEQFGSRVMEISGEGDGMRRADGTVIRRAEFVAPAFPQAAGEPSTRQIPQTPASPATIVPILTDNFEGAFPSGSWSLYDQNGTGHKWGKDNSMAHGGSYSIWECAAGSSALPPGSNYANGVMTWAVYGPFDLSDATSAELTFWASVQTADASDYLFWGASGNGSSFNGFSVSGGSGTWTEETFDMVNWLGDSSVWITFIFRSNGSGNARGIFLDDVGIVKTVASVSSPRIDTISPDNGPAGTGNGFLITLTGSNFGATKGTSTVRFIQNPLGTPPDIYEEATYFSSWSNTQIVCNVPERASSGLVSVIVGGEPSVWQLFTVSYGASSTSWAYQSEPMGVDILVNPSNSDVTAAEALDAIIKGLQEWNAEGGAAFSFTYGGQTGLCSSAQNGVNEICFGSTGGSLATNYSWFIGSNMIENNIIFNDVGYTFSTDLSPGTYDIQSIATHESGHSLRLLDLYGGADFGKTMYGLTSQQTDWHRTIEAADKEGIQYFYGAQTVNISTRALPDATTPTFYSAGLSASGGTAPYTFALRSGTSLPSNLHLASDGTVSGYCQEDGDFYFTVRVTDNVGHKDSQVVSLHIESSAPVVLEQFLARPVDEGVLVEWNLAQGADLGEFYVHRAVGDENGQYFQLNDEPFVPTGGLSGGFSFLDKDVVPGTLYFYKLEAREGADGIFFGPVSAVASGGRGTAYWLGQNRPNPFSPARDGATVITFSMPVSGQATVRVYDAAGRLVAVPFEGQANAGETDVLWDGKGRNGRSMPAGVYFYELYTPGFGSTRKMQIMR
jgi:hypothetical protein